MNKPKAETDRRGHADPAEGTGIADDPGLAFMGRLAHDLRGPLSPLQTAAYLLRREDIGPQRQRELLDIIDRQAIRLGSMLQEMSDWMRARRGNVGTRREAVNVPLLVELACAELAAAGGVLDLPSELDETEVHGDTQHLVQMLTTLVAYVQQNAGTASVRVRGSLAGRGLRLAIESFDRDPGHPATGQSFPASFDSLFVAPEQVPFDEGLGLRLLIAHAIAEAHGGSISAYVSASGHGELLVELPVMEPGGA
ncbi:MAG: HAMP domain-containing histidine kinase [Pseudomonadota bacterium]|nr:HAMP domain-containing histidine kinase [Pseudomonadota bacterium]